MNVRRGHAQLSSKIRATELSHRLLRGCFISQIDFPTFGTVSQPLGQYPNIWDNFLKIQNYLLSSSNLIFCLVKWMLSLPAPTTAQWYLWRKKKNIQYLDWMTSEQERFQTIKSKFRNKVGAHRSPFDKDLIEWLNSNIACKSSFG